MHPTTHALFKGHYARGRASALTHDNSQYNTCIVCLYALLIQINARQPTHYGHIVSAEEDIQYWHHSMNEREFLDIENPAFSVQSDLDWLVAFWLPIIC